MEEKAVKKAFPKLSASSIATIANWYINEGASEDFSTIRDFADFIESDFLDMFWAGDYDKDEFKEVAKDMISNGYYDEDDFPYEEDYEEVEQSRQKEKKDPCDIRDMVITDIQEPTDEMFYRYLDFCRAKLGINAYTFKVPSGRFEEVRKAFDEFMSTLSDEEIKDMRVFRRYKHKIGWFRIQQNEEGYYTSESAATHEKKVYDVSCTFDEFAKLEFKNNYSNVAYCVVEFNDDEEGLIENIPLSLQVFPIRKPGQDRLYLYEPANGTNIPREQIARIWVCSKDLKTNIAENFFREAKCMNTTFKRKAPFSESRLQASKNGKVSKKLKEDAQNLYFVGYCCCPKDKDLYSEPCFLGLGPDNTFRPIGWSYEDIYFGSRVEAGEVKEPSYMKPEDFHMTLNRLWVEIHTKDPRHDPNGYPADDICRALESVFPTYKFYATMYPAQDMEKYYSYISTDVPAEMKKAYEDLQNKLWKRRDNTRTTWEFPF